MIKLGALAAALYITAVLTACDSGGSAAASPAASPSALTSHAAKEAVSPDPNFDSGFTVQVTSDGFHPKWLVATCCQTVTWKNVSKETVTVVFDHVAGSSGPIPPGGSWEFTPANVESISYHLGSSIAITGVVQVQQNFES